MSYSNYRHDDYELRAAVDVLFPELRRQSLNRLVSLGFINADTLPIWLKELENKKYHQRLINYLIARLKIHVDEQIENYGGELTLQKTLGILKNVTQSLSVANKRALFQIDQIKQHTVLDFGAGVYSALSAALVLIANGFRQSIAYEPSPIVPEWVAASVAQTLKWLTFDPQKFIFSGIEKHESKHRLSQLDFERIESRLASFQRDEVDTIDFGGLILTKNLNQLPPGSVDLIFSNSVLEHILDLSAEMARQRNLLTKGGHCVHTVDFSDHRAQGTDLNIFQMYYDGILVGINGLRPSQMEACFKECHLGGIIFHRQSAPKEYIESTAGMLPLYSDFSIEELSVWVKSYVLTAK